MRQLATSHPPHVVGSLREPESRSRSERTTGGDDGVRTRDLVVANHALSQLSYIPRLVSRELWQVAINLFLRLTTNHSPLTRLGVLGFEPRTSALSELRSSQLSY